MRIANATQHTATEQQVLAGVEDLSHSINCVLKELLTFEDVPTVEEMVSRAEKIAAIIAQLGYKKAMIGGAPFFMGSLEKELVKVGIEPLYAFSKRESIEQSLEDGSVVKTNVFEHVGFVRV